MGAHLKATKCKSTGELNSYRLKGAGVLYSEQLVGVIVGDGWGGPA